MSHQLLDHIIGTPSKVRLLRALFAVSRPVTGREAARLAHVTQRPAIRALRELVQSGIVVREKKSTHHLYKLNRQHFLVRHGIIPLFQAEQRGIDATTNVLRQTFASMTRENGGPVIAVAAGGTDAGGSFSSADVLVIVAKDDQVSEAWGALKTAARDLEEEFGIEVVADVMSLARARARHKKNDPMIERLLEAGTTIVGRQLGELLAEEERERALEDESASPSGIRSTFSLIRDRLPKLPRFRL